MNCATTNLFFANDKQLFRNGITYKAQIVCFMEPSTLIVPDANVMMLLSMSRYPGKICVLSVFRVALIAWLTHVFIYFYFSCCEATCFKCAINFCHSVHRVSRILSNDVT